MRSSLLPLVPLALLAAVAACGGNDNGPDPLADPAAVRITPDSLHLVDCATGGLTGEVRDGHNAVISGSSITWSTLDAGVATVNGSGGVTAVAPGLAHIIAAHDTLKDTALVRVDSGTYTYKLTPKPLVVDIATPAGFSPVLRDCHNVTHPTTATFLSLDTSTVTVNASGVATAHKLGLSTIVVTHGATIDSVDVRVTRQYQFVLDTTITGGGRFYGVAVNTPFGYVLANRPDNAAVARYDLLSHALDLSAATVGATPTGISFDPAGKHAWVASQVGEVDELTANPVAFLLGTTVPFSAYWTVTTPNGGLVYASGNGNTVAVLAGSSGALLDTVPVGSTPFGLAMTPDGSTLFIGHLTNDTITKLVTATNVASGFKILAATANGMAVSPNGAELAIASEAGNMLYFLNPTTGAPVGQLPLTTPWGVAYLASGAEIWVTSLGGKVYRVNATTHALIDSIVVGGTPRGISIHPYGWGAVIGNEDGTLEILR